MSRKMTEKDTTTALSALLDFYSDRATAHASYFVAFTFGMFAILGIAQNAEGAYEKVILCALLWIVWFSGLYCLLNFGFFASSASKIRYAIRGDLILPFKKFRHEKDDQELEIKKGDPCKIREFSAKDIDDGIFAMLSLMWRLSTMRRIFLGVKYPQSRRKSEREVMGIWGPPRRGPLFFVYWFIFFLGSVAVFGWGDAYFWSDVYFWNFILLFVPLGFLLEDLIKGYGKVYCGPCGGAISPPANFCPKCGRKIV